MTLRFRPDGGPVTDVAVPGTSVRPVRCGPSACDGLQFEVPNTSSFVPGGLTGPTEIRVERVIDASTELVARVFELHQPTRGCEVANWVADPVFGSFTVLPPPNLLLSPVSPPLRGTLDGLGEPAGFRSPSTTCSSARPARRWPRC